MFFRLSRAWDKEKILSPYEESNLRSKGLGFDSSWGLRIDSLSHARDKTIKHLHVPLSNFLNI